MISFIHIILFILRLSAAVLSTDHVLALLCFDDDDDVTAPVHCRHTDSRYAITSLQGFVWLRYVTIQKT